jgi:hypothetical protein
MAVDFLVTQVPLTSEYAPKFWEIMNDPKESRNLLSTPHLNMLRKR